MQTEKKCHKVNSPFCLFIEFGKMYELEQFLFQFKLKQRAATSFDKTFLRNEGNFHKLSGESKQLF